MTVKNLSLLLLYGLSSIFSSGRFSFSLMAWLVPLLALLFLYSNDPRPSARLRWLFLVNWIALSIAWYGATPIWGLAHLVFMAFNAAVGISVYGLLLWVWRPGIQGFHSTLVFPALFVGVDSLMLAGSPFGSFGADAYSQESFLPFAQLASVTGLTGLSFFIAWTASTLLWCHHHGVSKSLHHPGPWSMAAALVIVLGWGAWQLQQPVSPTTLRVTGLTAQPVEMQQYMGWLQSEPGRFDAESRALHRLYLDATEDAARSGAQLVVWPELTGLGTYGAVEQLLADAGELAIRFDIHLLVPTLSVDPAEARVALNQAHLIDHNGDTLVRHVKFGGNFIEGTEAGPVQVSWADTRHGRIGVLICWDADFQDTVREAGNAELDYLFVVAKDWSGIDPLHGEMALFRAIENRVSLFRQADSGLSLAADAFGRVLGEARGAEHKLVVDLPIGQGPTLYSRFGNVLGWVCLASALLLLAGKSARHFRSL